MRKRARIPLISLPTEPCCRPLSNVCEAAVDPFTILPHGAKSIRTCKWTHDEFFFPHVAQRFYFVDMQIPDIFPILHLAENFPGLVTCHLSDIIRLHAVSRIGIVDQRPRRLVPRQLYFIADLLRFLGQWFLGTDYTTTHARSQCGGQTRRRWENIGIVRTGPLCCGTWDGTTDRWEIYLTWVGGKSPITRKGNRDENSSWDRFVDSINCVLPRNNLR